MLFLPRGHAFPGQEPLAGVFAEPAISVCINEGYLPYILGALEVLTVPEYWANPQTFVPQIELLMAELAKEPGDCGTPPSTFCASYDFASDDHSSIWSGLAVFGHGTPAYVPGIGWSLSTGCAFGGGSGTSAFMVMKATFPSPVTIDHIRITWGTTAESDSGGTYALVQDHVSGSGNDGAWQVLSSLHGSGWDGTETLGSHEKTDTEHFIEIQLIPAGGSSCPSGVMFIRQIEMFGIGAAPDDSTPCV